MDLKLVIINNDNMFKNAIVRIPGKSLVEGISSAELGIPDYNLAMQQHHKYIEALRQCAVNVTILEADENFPDSTFVEDNALLTHKCAIICNPGAVSRRGEVVKMKEVLEGFYENIEEIKSPGTMEAGDIMMVGDHFYIGLSERTNKEGAQQTISILEKYGLSGSMVELKEVLHLKTGLAYLENNNLIACGEFLEKDEFSKFNILKIDDSEAYAANCIWVNGNVIIPDHYPKAKEIIENAAYKTIVVDVSEFRKLDGGLSCLSLRF